MSDEQEDLKALWRMQLQPARRVVWQRLDTFGMEICSLYSHPPNVRPPFSLTGDVIGVLAGAPTQCVYTLSCDEMWNTTIAHVFVRGAKNRSLGLLHVGGRWRSRSPLSDASDERPARELPELSDCVDVDLGISPSTNTLPIRRLNLEVGESRELTAAWVRFPELTVEPLAQRYTRLAERRYRYESVVSGFTAELEVDDLGLVVTYEGIWQRVAESSEI